MGKHNLKFKIDKTDDDSGSLKLPIGLRIALSKLGLQLGRHSSILQSQVAAVVLSAFFQL